MSDKINYSNVYQTETEQEKNEKKPIDIENHSYFVEFVRIFIHLENFQMKNSRNVNFRIKRFVLVLKVWYEYFMTFYMLLSISFVRLV